MVAVMLITTSMITLIMLVVWKINIVWIVLFFLVFGAVEGLYFSSVLYKFTQGGYLPVAFSLVLMLIMGIWHYIHHKRYDFELRNKVSSEYMRKLAENPRINRVPGMGLLYSELVQGIPPIFPHFISSVPSIHSVLVFVSIKKLPVSRVLLEERFLFRQVEPREYRMFRCIARYGYMDAIGTTEEFEHQLVVNLKEFIRHESFIAVGGSSGEQVTGRIVSAPIRGAEEEMLFVQKAKDEGVVYLLGQAEVMAKQNSSFIRKIIVDCLYNFLRKNFRQEEQVLSIPYSKLLKVGMIYEI